MSSSFWIFTPASVGVFFMNDIIAQKIINDMRERYPSLMEKATKEVLALIRKRARGEISLTEFEELLKNIAA